MVVGRAIKSYGDGTGQVKNPEASTGLKRMVSVTSAFHSLTQGGLASAPNLNERNGLLSTVDCL